ncbi:MAG: ABC transporter permease [Thermomicrobiales bacterium]|nr:ABC transporter permease [Thermomicrobiales bacterium]
MSPRRAFLQKEIMEYLRTWRIWLLVLPVLIFAIIGPAFSYFTADFTGEVLDIADTYEEETITPDWFAAYSQWTYSLRQILPVLLVLIAGSTIAGECATGTAIPILASGLSRRDFVVLKFAVASGMACAVIVAGTLTIHLISLMLYPQVPWLAPVAVIGVASLLAMLLIAMALFFSTIMPDVFGAVGLEMFLFLALAAASLWEPARRYSPVGLLTSLSDIVKYNEINVLVPGISAVVCTILLVMMSVSVFERREL